jgi:lipopolysaccharide export system permease protein
MRILTRYLLRAHLAPFLFSISVLTGLLLINTVARRFEELAGKGLPPSVIAEVFALSIPYTLALTLPMSVLVAVLYAFSQMTADNEITALKASGVNLVRLTFPLFLIALLLTGGMVWFNDQVLPEANHRLKNLLVDIARKSPTLELKEQAINEIRTEGIDARYFLQAARIEAATNRLYDVVIYDLSAPERDRTIYADSGQMAFNRARTDLYLTLYDGWIHEHERREPARFNRVYFDRQSIRIPEVGNQLERMGGGSRGDREMTVAMLAAEVASRGAELEKVREEARELVARTLTEALGEAGSKDSGAMALSPAPSRRGDREPMLDSHTRRTSVELQSLKGRAESLEMGMNQYRVEWHKKFAIPFACIVFVLIGAPLAVRFPRGGVGMVIAFSLVIFAIYWSGLTGGEQLGDKGVVPPFWAMWTVNALFLMLGLFAIARFGRERGSARGGGIEGMFDRVRERWGERRRLRERGVRA